MAPPPRAARVGRLICGIPTSAESTFGGFSCRGLHALPARLSLHALSSQARHWLGLRTAMFWILTISSTNCTRATFTIPAISGNFCNTDSQEQGWMWNGAVFCTLSLHHNSTLFCCSGFCQSCGDIRLDHFEPSNESCALSCPP